VRDEAFTYGETLGPGPDTSDMTAAERRDTAYRRRKAFLRNIGLPDARSTNGRPDRPSNRPEKRAEYRRRTRIRAIAAEYGISEAAAEYLTPRRPRNGRRENVARDDAGRFLAKSTSPVAPGRKVQLQ
jgi:hypothetical protein